MGLRIVEFFGYDPLDSSVTAVEARNRKLCPFYEGHCTKELGEDDSGNTILSGTCTVRQVVQQDPIVCCPKRLYAEKFIALRDIAKAVFDPELPFHFMGERRQPVRHVVAIGKDFGGEVRLPGVKGTGSFFVDWILALVGQDGKLEQFVAVEVQSIDTTGNYRAERAAYLKHQSFEGNSVAGVNWENVNKRILPQLIFKGHVLRLEPLCKSGLFFICPQPVLDRIKQRVGNALRPYPVKHPGTINFRGYGLDAAGEGGTTRKLKFQEELTTTVDQLAIAFTAPMNLPPSGAYASAIAKKLGST